MLKRLAPALIALVAGPALAADLPSTKAAPVFVPPVVAYDWTGLYIGADVGGAWAEGRYSSLPGSVSVNGDSILGGGFIGYNKQYGQFVLGLEGDVQGLGIDKTVGVLRVQQNLLAAINGRLGVAFDRILVYAIGGVGFSDTKFWNNGPSYTDSDVGFDIGGGVEYAYLPDWTLRAEYRYYDFGKTNKTTLAGANFGFEKTDNTVRVGVAYKFGVPAAIPVVAKY
ncbi:hypothetical protein CCR94_12175 [Rhodoblastus sphagnicola]|uniref:Outer membrane protein beta-barrel domain-containing protein n=1 Tax=Rhodoblastus sphagnicola TaxID=333368 RepID=A0A2S6N7H2_9HYPH|nr:outer membrane protein [Rhodoblastus sphagnicola]MBB4196239.1 outer membrane immunogenic protein [Rhodoblastus sphagnicola]PPQ30563.1 hypothetical protein CCR94_12175 [Rhodoblastus sphagnicola]